MNSDYYRFGEIILLICFLLILSFMILFHMTFNERYVFTYDTDIILLKISHILFFIFICMGFKKIDNRYYILTLGIISFIFSKYFLSINLKKIKERNEEKIRNKHKYELDVYYKIYK